MAPSLRELIALALLAGLGCGVALAHDDLFFVAVFGLASAIRLLRRYEVYEIIGRGPSRSAPCLICVLG